MKVGLLSYDPELEETFRRDHPYTSIYSEVTEELLSSDLIILQDRYFIDPREEGDADDYDILEMWTKFLRIRSRNKIIVLLGWRNKDDSLSETNYFQLNQLPPDFRTIQYEKIKDEPILPKSKNKDVLEILEAYLLSHGYSFRAGWKDTRLYLLHLESQVRKKKVDEVTAMSHDSMKELHLVEKNLEYLWKLALPYLKLTPFFPQILEYEVLHKDLKELLYQERFSLELSENINLPERIAEYLKKLRIISTIYKTNQSHKQ